MEKTLAERLVWEMYVALGHLEWTRELREECPTLYNEVNDFRADYDCLVVEMADGDEIRFEAY